VLQSARAFQSDAAWLDEVIMPEIFLHHVSITCTNLAASVDFYCTVLGLKLIQRPPFKSLGAWLACGSQHIHLNEKPVAPFPADKIINPTEPHFALRCGDFDAKLAQLAAAGFREGGSETDRMRMVVDRDGPAGFPQVFILDPDRNTVEINAAS
jgi:catechol 2,3-dioxygenase-like lactoylglutathione lyase family enzyme